jgi:large subunit ribosomal protein L7A
MDADLSDPRKRVVGQRQILRALGQGRLTKVVIAKDADVRMIKEMTQACLEAGVPYEQAEGMKELGSACRIAVGAAAAGLLRAET